MPLIPAPLEVYLFHAKVLNTYPEVRLIDVQFIDTDTVQTAVRVVQDSSTFSFPRKDEVGLCIGSDPQGYYYLGKIDFGYAKQLNKKVTIPNTNRFWPIKKVKDGETYISHMLNGIGLLFSNSGNFALTAFNQDGIKYIYSKIGEPFRWLKGTAKSILLSSITSNLSLGAVIRAIPVQGDKIVRSLIDPTKAAQEFLVSVTRIIGIVPKTIVKLHLGEILTEPVIDPSTPIPEFNVGMIPPSPLRAKLVVSDDAGATELAYLRIDNAGGVELKGTLGMVVNALQVFIGTNHMNVSEPAVKGQSLYTWLANHKHPTGTGPSGPPTPEDQSTLGTILSQVVFVG
jgi:hypothetical protein